MPLNKTAKLTDIERFANKFTILKNGCWHYASGKPGGRGNFHIKVNNKNKTYSAYKFLYEVLNGPVAKGLVLDHLCNNPYCVSPEHLEPKTQRENVLRGTAPPAKNARKVLCKRGHEFGEQPKWIQKLGTRRCLTCHNMRHTKAWRTAL